MFTVLDTELWSERIDLLVRVMCMKETNICLIKIRSKHSSNTLLRFFMRQTSCISILYGKTLSF